MVHRSIFFSFYIYIYVFFQEGIKNVLIKFHGISVFSPSLSLNIPFITGRNSDFFFFVVLMFQLQYVSIYITYFFSSLSLSLYLYLSLSLSLSLSRRLAIDHLQVNSRYCLTYYRNDSTEPRVPVEILLP